MFEKYINFENKGEMDLNSLFLMGCSTKSEDTSKIWQFWTGLKYALAVMLRKWIRFEIFIWTDKIEFDTKNITVNWQIFERVYINWNETWFTTELWKHWELWQGIREFYANCLDENWSKLSWRWKRKWKIWYTRVFIKENDIREEMYRFKFDKWIKIDDNLSYIHKDKLSPLRIYKQGFLVYEWTTDEQSILDYQVNDININEMRLVEDRYDAMSYIGEIIARLKIAHSIYAIIESKEYKIANFFTWDNEITISTEWIKVLNWFTPNQLNWLPNKIVSAYKADKSKTDDSYCHWSSAIYRIKETAYVVEQKGTINIWRDRKDAKVFLSWLSDKTKKFDIIKQEDNVEIHINILFKDDFEIYKNVAAQFLLYDNKESQILIVDLLEIIERNKKS